MANLIFNKRAIFDYTILEKYEAGLVLSGQEVKSLKNSNASLKESFVTARGQELFLTNAYINPYKNAKENVFYSPTQPRKLLLRKAEIKHLIGKIQMRGLTLVPIKLYTKGRLIKLEFGLGKGKQKRDKREQIKKRETERKIRTILLSNNK